MEKHSFFKLTLICCAMLFLLAAASCGESGSAYSAEDALIAEDGSTPYIIVRPDVENGTVIKCTTTLGNLIEEKIGANLKLTTDFLLESKGYVEIDTEILVGNTNREESEALMSELSRSRDWAVARVGSKIVIAGNENLMDAVNYFAEHHVIDGNIYMKDGEKYVHTDEYEIDSFTLAGKDVTEYLVSYELNNTMAENAAKRFAAYVHEMYGKSVAVDLIRGKFDGDTIYFSTDASVNALGHRIYWDGGTLNVASGIIASCDEALDALLAHIDGATTDKNVEIGKDLDLSIKGEKENMKIADAAYMAALDKKADTMKEAVLNSKSEYTLTKASKVYYFAADGNDANDGLSEKTPKQTIGALNGMNLLPGDVVLFRRGDMFRGNVNTKTGVTYSAYGEGAKPIINASKMNYADPALWEKTDYENVWVCTKPLSNVGIVALDHSGELGKYDELVGKRMIAGRGDFTGAATMTEDLQVWSELETNKLYFYSAEGNPGERFKSIEIGERGHVFSVGVQQNVTIDNLHITLTGAHGVSAGTTRNLTVRNCIFNWLGGSILTGFAGGNVVGYGNAVEVYGGVDGYNVYNNWIYQIYDTGITHQFNVSPDTKSNKMVDVEYHDNLIEYCYWSIEYYNYKNAEDTDLIRVTKDVWVHDNYCRLGGYGWGCVGRADSSPMYSLGVSFETIENYITENNIFDRCLGYLVVTKKEDCILRNNTYVQPLGAKYMLKDNQNYFFNPEAAKHLAAIGEENPELAFIIEDEKAE